MNLFSNYINPNQNFKNSSIFYWQHSKKNYMYKSNNFIIGYFKDSIVKEKIYFSNNGLKNNAIFHRKQIVNNLKYNDKDKEKKKVYPTNKYNNNQLLNNFVSFFYNVDDNFFKFNIYSLLYFKKINKYFKHKQQLFFLHKNFKKEKYNDKEIYSNLIKEPFLINLKQKKFFLSSLLTKKGQIKTYPKSIIDKYNFSGAQVLFPWKMKKIFSKLFKLQYLIIYFFSNSLKKNINSINFLYNYLLYNTFSNYILSNIISYLKNKKKWKKQFRFQKKNKILIYFFRKYIKKLRKIKAYIKFYIFHKYKQNINYNRLSLLQFFFMKKIYLLFSNKLNTKSFEIKSININNSFENILWLKYNFIFISFLFNKKLIYNYSNISIQKNYFFLKYRLINDYINNYLLNSIFYNNNILNFINFNTFVFKIYTYILVKNYKDNYLKLNIWINSKGLNKINYFFWKNYHFEHFFIYGDINFFKRKKYLILLLSINSEFYLKNLFKFIRKFKSIKKRTQMKRFLKNFKSLKRLKK